MKVFVTGASGFIGKYVVQELLSSNYRVVVLCHEKSAGNFPDSVQRIYGNLESINTLVEEASQMEIDICIHLAWEGIPDFSYDMSLKNLSHGLKLLDFCKKLSIKTFLCSGSCFEYDNPKGKISEEYRLSSSNSFKASKNSFQFMANSFCQENKIDFYWLRLFYVYGKGQRDNSLIPYIINSFKNNQLPEIGKPENANDFIHVEDVARAIVLTLEKKPLQPVINIGTGTATKVEYIVQTIARLLDYDSSLIKMPKQDNPISFFADMAVAEKYLDFKAHISISEGIERTVKESL